MTTRQANDKHCSSNASGNDPDKAERLPIWAVAMSNSHQSKNDEHCAAERSYWAAQQRHQAQTTRVALLALFAAGASAWYTLQQVSVAEDQERKSLRAYISSVPNYTGLNSSDGNINIRFIMTNHGQTPAIHTVFSAIVAAIDYPLKDGFAFPPLNGLSEPAVIFPTMTRRRRPG